MRRLLNRVPSPAAKTILGILPFIVFVLFYFSASAARLAENPNDKLLPGPDAFGAAIERVALEPDRRTGKYLLWNDTAASLRRLAIGLGIATASGLAFGVTTGLLPLASATLGPLIAAISVIPPLAVLPILFIAFGLGETGKLVLIVIGTAPFLMRDVAMRVGEIPTEQMIKAQTLGASTWQIALRVVLPQVLPRLIDGVRLSLGPAWMFLIASEAIAATEGLGYRIFLVRRYLAMDVILPYVAWITFLAFALDTALRMLSERAFPWAKTKKAGA